jgi:hypothetical protein
MSQKLVISIYDAMFETELEQMEGHERQQGENYISEIHSLALKIHI